MFRRRAVENGVPESVVDLLAEFYGVSNGIPCLNSLVFHRCDDEILFEWWDDGELWLGQRDNDVLRWADDKFCLGDASNISYSQEDEFDTLVDLLEAVLARSFGCR